MVVSTSAEIAAQGAPLRGVFAQFSIIDGLIAIIRENA